MSPTAQMNWRTGCRYGSTPATAAESRPDTAGHGANPRWTTSSPTSRSKRGSVRGNPKETKVGEAPARSYWGFDPGGFDQVGCIYTAQGFKYDYSGVIMGPGLVWRDNRWVSRPEYSKDYQVRGAAPDDFDRAIRNTYQVLLSRGMRGTLVY